MKTAIPTDVASGKARERMRRPLFCADWLRVVFLHYEVDPDALQPIVPFALRLRDGRAYVSLVAFTMERMRLEGLGRFGQWLVRPISDHGFLNVRTYVRTAGETGIYFLAEWLSNRIAVPLGRPVFGLPYRFGTLDYSHGRDCISGSVRDPNGALRYRAELHSPLGPAAAGSLDEFLLEQYTAFTEWRGLRRRFRVWHEPWMQTPISPEIADNSLLGATGGWAREARLAGANYSPGAHGVWMGRPEMLP